MRTVTGPWTMNPPLPARAAARHEPLLFTFPSDDRLFRQVVSAEVTVARSEGLRPQTTRRRVRMRYADADVQRQHDVMIGTDPVEVWFAFRDGRDAPIPHPHQWWNQPGVARATIHPSGGLSQYNRAFRALFGIADSRSALAQAGEMLPRAIDAALWPASSWLRRLGEVTSTAVIATVNGPRRVEFHAVWMQDGPKRYQLALRSFEDRDAAIERDAIDGSGLGVVEREALDELVRTATRRDLARGERLAESIVGDPWAALVVSGVARVYLAAKGLEPTIAYGRHASLRGTHLGGGGRSFVLGLQAVMPTRILQFDPRRIQALVTSDARFASAVAEDARSMLRDVIRKFALRSSASLGQRLAREILLIQQLQESEPLVSVTEQQLGDSLGSIRESVSRAMGEFRRRGWIATTRYGLIPLNLDELRAIAEADED